MDNLPQAPGFSVFYTDPGEARWILRGPENTFHLFGHCKNQEHNGFLIRDAEEARAMVRRAAGMTLERFGDLDPFNPTEEEIQAMELQNRPYVWLWLRSDQLKINPAEIPTAPTRRELFHFVRDKHVLLARQNADTANLQSQVDKLQGQIDLLLERGAAPVAPDPVMQPVPAPLTQESLPPASL